MIQKLTIVLLFALLNLYAFADEFVVLSFTEDINDMAARQNEKKDQNDKPCALIKIYTDLTELTFESNRGIVASEYKPGEYWVFIPEGTNQLYIGKTKFIKLSYTIPIPVKQSTVYKMKLTYKYNGPVAEVQPEYVKIKTTPPGAKVYINNEYKGITPYNQKHIEGTYNYRLEKAPFYYNHEGKFELKFKNPIDLNITLKPKFGTITITSTPETGAEITLDSKPINQKTPYTITELLSGTHTIELIKDLYEPATQEFTVTDGQIATQTIPIKPIYGEVNITTNPTDATIYIDDIKTGVKGTYNTRLLNGTHVIEAKKTDYNCTPQTIEVKTGTKENYNIELKPKTGSIDISTTPIDVEIWLNGENKGLSNKTLYDLKIGTYNLELKLTGYGIVKKTVTVEENKTIEINEVMPQGEQITIRTIPAGTKIKIDEGVEQITPFIGTLSYGTHYIIAMPSDGSYIETTESITITQGGNTNFNILLKTDNTFTDSRDGKTYKTVKIGAQTWMAENLNYDTKKGSWCYNNIHKNCENSGKLYDWKTAKKSCPKGWHIPTDIEWNTLEKELGLSNPDLNQKGLEGSQLKDDAISNWNDGYHSIKKSGFAALPCGKRMSNGIYTNFGADGYWWSATSEDALFAFYRNLNNHSSTIQRNYDLKTNGFSCRCVKNN